jgi:hypothetical protein
MVPRTTEIPSDRIHVELVEIASPVREESPHGFDVLHQECVTATVPRPVKNEVLPYHDDMASTVVRHPRTNAPGRKLGARVHRQEGASKHMASASRKELLVAPQPGQPWVRQLFLGPEDDSPHQSRANVPRLSSCRAFRLLATRRADQRRTLLPAPRTRADRDSGSDLERDAATRARKCAPDYLTSETFDSALNFRGWFDT